MNNLDIILIGKNEEKNLEKTFKILNKYNLLPSVIFVDSSSDDDSLKIANDFKVRNFSIKGFTSPSIARSFGADKGDKEWIFFIDGDVVPSESFMSQIKNLLLSDLDLFFGWKYDLTKYNEVSFHAPKKEIFCPDYLGGNFLIKREIYKSIGGWNRKIEIDEERELLCRVYKKTLKVKQINLCLGTHFNIKKSNRSIKERYFGYRSKEEVKTFFYCLKNHFFQSLLVYRFCILNMLALFMIFSFNINILFLGIFIFIFNLLFNLNSQPGKYLMPIKIFLYLF